MTETERQLQRIADALERIASNGTALAAPALPLQPQAPAPTAPPAPLLFDWLDEWYKVYKVPRLKATSLYQIRNCLDKHIKRHIANKPLTDIKAIDIQKALNLVEGSRIRKYVHDTIGDCLKQAYKLDLIPVNIIDKIDGVPHTRKKGIALTREQEKHFLSIIQGNRLELLYLFYLASGCRKSEALAIKWTDVDYINNRIYINGTKTICAKRYIPLFDDIRAILSKLPQDKTEYLFPYADHTVKNSFRWLKTKYGLPYSIHTLRHTFSTRHYENGVKPKIIQKWMGHAKVETTQDIYTAVLSDFEQAEFIKANNARHLLAP